MPFGLIAKCDAGHRASDEEVEMASQLPFGLIAKCDADFDAAKTVARAMVSIAFRLNR